MMKYINKIGLLLLIGLCLSCTKEKDDNILLPQADYWNTGTSGINGSDSANNGSNGASISSLMQGRYKGIWDINGVLTDTLAVRLNVDREYYFAFDGLPLKAITEYIYPGMQIRKITDEALDGVPLKNEDALWLKTLVDYGDNRVCLESYLSVPLALVGYSTTMVYFEYPAAEDAPYRYYPYVVTPADGNYFAIVLDVVPHASKVAVDISTQTLTCTLIIRKVEIVSQNGDKTVKTLNPEMKLTFTALSKTGN